MTRRKLVRLRIRYNRVRRKPRGWAAASWATLLDCDFLDLGELSWWLRRNWGV